MIFVKKLSNCQKKTGWNSTLQSLKLSFHVKKSDQCSVHLYADDTEITCKSSANDLGIIITSNLKWASHINQRLSKAQQKLFFLEKRSLFYKYESKRKFIQKLPFINSLRVKCMVLEWGRLQKTRKDAKTSAQWALNKNFFNR